MKLSVYLPIVLFVLILLWCFMIFMPLLMHNSLSAFTTLFFRESGRMICHQESAKLIALGEYSSLVCSRCAGIYLGALASSFWTLFSFIPRGKLSLLIGSCSLMAADVFLVNAGIYTYTKTVAFSTGLFFGSVCFLYFYEACYNLLGELKQRNK